MYGNSYSDTPSRPAPAFIREYIVPTLGRIAACALGIGVGYIVANM